MTYIIIIVLIVYVVRLSNRVGELEERVGIRKKEEPQQPPDNAKTQVTTPVAPIEPKTQVINQDASASSLGDWFKEDWLFKLGGLLILIGLGWFVNYAFTNNWIGPVGRISLGVIVGILISLLGHFRYRSQAHQGEILQSLGTAIILLSIFAGRAVYDFFTPISAMALMSLPVLYVSIFSFIKNNKILLTVGLGFALLVPLLIVAPSQDFIRLFGYLFLVSLFYLTTSFLKKWEVVALLNLMVIILYSLGYWAGPLINDSNLGLFLPTLIAVLFTLRTVASIIRDGYHEKTIKLFLPILTGLFVGAWINTIAEGDVLSFWLSAWAVIYFVIAIAIYRINKEAEYNLSYVLTGFAMLAIATAVKFDSHTLVTLLAIEAVVAFVVYYFSTQSEDLAAAYSLLIALPALLSLQSFSNYSNSAGVYNNDLYLMLLMSIILLGYGLFWKKINSDIGESTDHKHVALVFFSAAGIFFGSLFWLYLHKLDINPDFATGIALTTYTSVGLYLHFYGKLHNRKDMSTSGGIILVGVVLRLLLVEIWELDIVGRVTIFILVGALLASTAFFGNDRKKSTAEVTLNNKK